jgi:mono/diheme cytochrome c family protein
MASGVSCRVRCVVAVGAGVAVAGFAGCSRPPDASFALRAEAEELDLPARQAAQIAAYLELFHGTPADPRMAVPDERAVAESFEAYEAAREARNAAGETKAEPLVTAGNASGAYPIAGADRPGFGRPHLQLGRQVYTAHCAGCHGTTGDGRGPAGVLLDPPPRDYRNGVFKFASTARGSKPCRDDLRAEREFCTAGNGMPALRVLRERETEAVIDYVIMLASRGELELALVREAETELDAEDDFDPAVVADCVAGIADSWRRADDEIVHPITVNPPRTAETIMAGGVAFAEFACVRCHGPDARGSRSAAVSQDIWGHSAHPANLAIGRLRGGRRPIDIYRRIYSGINGTPMPSAKDPNTAVGETPEERSDRIWHLVHFVTAVIESDGVPPDCQEAIYDVLQKQTQPREPAAAEVGEPPA